MFIWIRNSVADFADQCWALDDFIEIRDSFLHSLDLCRSAMISLDSPFCIYI